MATLLGAIKGDAGSACVKGGIIKNAERDLLNVNYVVIASTCAKTCNLEELRKKKTLPIKKCFSFTSAFCDRESPMLLIREIPVCQPILLQVLCPPLALSFCYPKLNCPSAGRHLEPYCIQSAPFSLSNQLSGILAFHLPNLCGSLSSENCSFYRYELHL